MSGNWKEGEGFYITNFDFRVEKQGETPTSVFLLKTLWAMFGLSSKVKIQIPVLNQKATMSSNLDIAAISDLLQVRRISYRLMVIEKNFHIKLPFPKYIEGVDVENIAYCYHSIIDRRFEWFCSPVSVPWFATSSYLSLLPEKQIPFAIQYGPEPVEKYIFNHRIDLGLQIIKINEHILDNFEEVKAKLSKLDGSKVWTQSRSKNGVMLVESVTTPTLPENAFTSEIQKLIDLDSKLDSIVLNKYFALATSAFEGLTEEQKETILERPDLDEDAFDF